MEKGGSHEALVRQAVAGDRLAISDLLLEHYDWLQKYIARHVLSPLAGSASTDDILQESLMRAIRGISEFEPRSRDSFRTWLRTIADHVLQSAVVAQARKKRVVVVRRAPRPEHELTSSIVDLVDLLIDSGATPCAAAAKHEAVRAVQVGIAGLPESQRLAVQLCYLRGRSVPETADELSRSPAAVRGLLHRAKSRLRDALGRSSRWFGRK